MSQEINPLLQLIKNRMSDMGIKTQAALSDKSGVGRSNLSRFFNGKEIKASNVHKILSALDLLCVGDLQQHAPQGVHDAEHLDIINQFKNRKWAREVNRTLLEIETDLPERMEAAKKAVRDILHGKSPYIEHGSGEEQRRKA